MDEEICKKDTEYTKGLSFKLTDDNISYVVAGIGSAKDCTEIIIPPEYNDKPVTAIADEAFKECNNIHRLLSPTA